MRLPNFISAAIGRSTEEHQPSEIVDQATAVAPVRKKRKHAEEQLRYLSQAVILEEASSPLLLSSTALIASLAVGGFLLWAAVTPINEVSRAPGEVVPSSFEQVVQHLDGGIIKAIGVTAGKLVEKDQVLVTIDDGATTETLERAKSKLLFLEMTAHRLNANLSKQEPNFDQFKGANNGDIEAQLKLYRSTLAEQTGREQIVREQILQKERDVKILLSRLDSAKKNLASERSLLDDRMRLKRKGLVSRSVLIKTKQGVVSLEGEVIKLGEQIEQSKVALDEYKSRLDSIYQSENLASAARLNQTTSEIKQVKSTIQQLVRRFDRLEIRAPVRGIVKELRTTTIGSVLKPGEIVAVIVPVDDELVADARIKPQDIGHMRKGQNVNVKISAYDYSRYGVVKGVLQQISATTFKDANGQIYYKGRIRLAQPFIGANAGQNLILPGMTIMADIQTGEKTILDYLLKPVKVAAATAFSER